MNPLPAERSPRTAHVLVVDDDAPTVRMIRFLLESEGFDVSGAPDAEIALGEYLRHPPDVILLNVIMPGTDGLDLHDRLRRLGYLGPVVFVTARPDVLEILAGRQMAVAGCLVKPLHPEEVVLLVRQVLDSSGKRESVQVERSPDPPSL